MTQIPVNATPTILDSLPIQPKLIGISGKAGHGKDTAAKLLPVARVAFADALKRDAFWTLIQAPLSPYLGVFESMDPRPDPITFINNIKHLPVVRAFLQNYGQAMRHAQPDYWIVRLFRNLDPVAFGYAITDVRYPNEADAIKHRGGIVVRVWRPNFDNDLTPEAQAHDSETALDDYPFDAVLVNDGTLDQLREEIRDNFTVQRYLRRETSDGEDLTTA